MRVVVVGNRIKIFGCKTFRDQYLRPSLLGAIDGLITSFVIVAGGIASEAPRQTIILIGFSSLIADGLSMGVSEHLSSRAQDDLTYWQASILGMTCFLSFIFTGSFPLIGYTIGQSELISRILSSLAFLVMLASVAVCRAIITQERPFKAIVEIVGLGSLAGGIAYGVASIR